MDIKQFASMMMQGCNKVIAAEQELTDIDAKFGDADHGLTMNKVMTNVKKTLETASNDTSYRALLDDVSMAVMSINGGSAVPLWSTFFEGMSENAPESSIIEVAEFKAMFVKGYETLAVLSKAQVGDKTMMDSLIPAVKAMEEAQGSIKDCMKAASEAAIVGAKASEGFISKFGRAKSYKEQTIGTPDAGAVSMQYFFVGMNEGI